MYVLAKDSTLLAKVENLVIISEDDVFKLISYVGDDEYIVLDEFDSMAKAKSVLQNISDLIDLKGDDYVIQLKDMDTLD